MHRNVSRISSATNGASWGVRGRRREIERERECGRQWSGRSFADSYRADTSLISDAVIPEAWERKISIGVSRPRNEIYPVAIFGISFTASASSVLAERHLGEILYNHLLGMLEEIFISTIHQDARYYTRGLTVVSWFRSLGERKSRGTPIYQREYWSREADEYRFDFWKWFCGCLWNGCRLRRHWICASKHEGKQIRYGRSPHLGEPCRRAASVSFRASNHEPSIMKPEASGYRCGMAQRRVTDPSGDFSSLHRRHSLRLEAETRSPSLDNAIRISENRKSICSVCARRFAPFNFFSVFITVRCLPSVSFAVLESISPRL